MADRNRLIMGSALGLAALAVAIDHTRHRLPEPVAADGGAAPAVVAADPCALGGGETPCGLEIPANPCGMAAEPPCGLDAGNPCGYGEGGTPCGI